jgi:hypothetical protein
VIQNIGVPNSIEPTTSGVLLLSSCHGPVVTNPAPADIERLLRSLSDENWFAILERTDGWYVQVGLGEPAGIRPGWYALERREGSAHSHFQAIATDLKEIIRAFHGFASDDEEWIRRFAWQRLDF